MGKIIQFEQEKIPVFSSLDFKEYVGYCIKDVVSDENDCNVKIVLENKTKDKAEIWFRDSTIDGESIFIIDRRYQNE